MPVETVRQPHLARYLRERSDPHGGLAPVRKVALLSTAYSWTLGLPKWEIDENPYYGVRHNRDRLKRREGGHAPAACGDLNRGGPTI